MKNLKPILLVEDDKVDVLKVERALRDKNILNPVVHPDDGELLGDWYCHGVRRVRRGTQRPSMHR